MPPIRKYSANYSTTNYNFVIQNLSDKRIDNEHLSAICIIKNLIQRGYPTPTSKYLKSQIGEIDLTKLYPLISPDTPNWERIIRGDVKNNYYPARKFFEELIPKYFVDFPIFQQLLTPEVPINYITQIDVVEYSQQQVDFYLPLAFLVIEIDGTQHDPVEDAKRDSHLKKFGVETIRISTTEVESENEGFQKKVLDIKQHIALSQKDLKKRKSDGQLLFSFEDYLDSIHAPLNLNEAVYKATSILRFQMLILELLENGTLEFNSPWNICVYCNEQEQFEHIACEDIFIWFENLFQLQRLVFEKPDVNIIRVSSFMELSACSGDIKIDFSLLKRYTDEFQNHSDILFIRTDYFENYRYYTNINSTLPKYVGLERYNYFKISTTSLVNYKIQIGGKWAPEKALSFFLSNIFNYKSFNQGQLAIVVNALMRNDTIGLLPTGGGKSICYQLAVLLQPAISFVVCPIKSLMYDQKIDLENKSIHRVNLISSDDDGGRKEKTMKEFVEGKYFFIFISPERFQTTSFRQYLLSVTQNHKIAFAVIDEVHCLSEWGHDFRTSYLNLSKTIRRHCSDFRFIGLTATASSNVLKDIQLEFGIKQENVKTLADYTRPELDFEIIDDKGSKFGEITNVINRLQELESILSPQEGNTKCGLVFTPTVNGPKGCYKLSLALENEFRVPVKYYSGQVPAINGEKIMKGDEFDEFKKQVQLGFKNDEFTLLTATKAFGMGINKNNIFYTIHYGMPSSMESLYQEAGRAGRDKERFKTRKAQCIVLFTKNSNDDILRKIWEPKTTLPQLKELLPQLNGDINTNLFLFQNSIDSITNEYDLIIRIISSYAAPRQKNVNVIARELLSNKAKTEKAIYRLSQLGIVDDWTVSNFFTGEFKVDFADFSDSSIRSSLVRTIKKYDKEFDFEALEINEKYSSYYSIWRRQASKRDRYIVILLQWSYNHFAYNRRQSLKNIYENCNAYISGNVTKKEFKQALESYFKFSEVTFLLQHIAENPSDFQKWFEVFYQNSKNSVFDEIINWEQRQSLIANLSRLLESYEHNTGLDFISGVLRLLIDDYENVDGINRFESSFRQIVKYSEPDFDFILDHLLMIGSKMSIKGKNSLAMSLLDILPDIERFSKRINKWLVDDFTTEILLSNLNKRMDKINQHIYGGLIQIR